MIVKPRPLRRGDVVGILSPSSEIKSFPQRTARALRSLEALGLLPRLAPHALDAHGQVPAPPATIADDLHMLLEDASVAGILCSTGGWSSNTILPFIDWNIVSRNPKVFVGFSDITALLCGFYARTGLCVFHGPTLLPCFGDAGGPLAFTIENFERVVFGHACQISLPTPDAFTDERLFWDREDTRPRKLRATTPWGCLHGGDAEGPLIGGNLTTLGRLVGTPFLPDFKGAILLLEESGSSVAQVEAILSQFDQAGLLTGIRGLVFGRPSQFIDTQEDGLHARLRALGERLGVPVLADVDFGHTEPRLTIPIGVRARLDGRTCTLNLLESAVDPVLAHPGIGN
jgi:muramoyltetrapeptide carboxypeptidase